ncbi:MAG TPA: hypothetical protein QGG77_02205, partial [Prochlorococcaceae cyanobacterium Gl_MAG_24]|nr:hypothetical protein [Prochlorococcaceae cyanobacterium Gl_MAG_24]
MASSLPSGPSDALRRGAFGLVLAMPLVAAPVLAQTPEPEAPPPVKELIVEDEAQVEEPRVLITEVIIE